MESPLRSAQDFNKLFAETHKSIVDGLRRQGWNKDDAIIEADEREKKALLKFEARKK